MYAVLGDLQQGSDGQMGSDGHLCVGIVWLIAQLDPRDRAHLLDQSLRQRRPLHDQDHCFQRIHLPTHSE